MEPHTARPGGTEILVVSGLPRSGTSLMMGMLRAGGIELLTDGVRRADLDNPCGYFELERVRSLASATDTSWLESARGKALKVISALLRHLPRTHAYRVLFMRRDLEEVLVSQARMLEHRGARHDPEGDAALGAELDAHVAITLRMLRDDPAFEVLEVSYAELLQAPEAPIEAIARFVGKELDRDAMRACIDPALYRVRSASRPPEIP